MKKCCIPFLLLLTFSCYGQDTLKQKHHEIGFGFTNIFHLFGGYYSDAYYYDDDGYGPSGYWFYAGGYWGNYGASYGNGTYDFNPGYGLSYKYHLKNGAIRAGMDFAINNSKSNGHVIYNSSDTITKWNMNYNKLVLKAGYQFEKAVKKICVFGGADVFYYKSSSDYDLKNSLNSSYTETGNSTVSGFGVTPFGGVKFQVSEIFSISTEARMRIGSYTFSGSYSGIDQYNVPYNGDNSGSSFETKFNPLGLVSFNFHF